MANSCENVSVSSIEGLLSRTIISSYGKGFQKIILGNLRNVRTGSNVEIQNIDVLATGRPETAGLGDELIRHYDSNVPSKLGDSIPDIIKIEQAAVVDSLMFGYDTQTGKIGLYTLNDDILLSLGIDNGSMWKKAAKKNNEGVIYAYRIETEYLSEDKIDIRGVMPKSKTCIYANTFVLFPYSYVRTIMEVICQLLDGGAVLKVVQDLGGLYKTRYVTQVEQVLKNYCDNPDAVKGLKTRIYPFKGFMYIPSIGSPSTTAMVTRVDLLSVDRIEPIKNSSEIKVEKARNPIYDKVSRSAVSKSLLDLKVSNPKAYTKVLGSFPDADGIFKAGEAREDISEAVLSKYLNQVRDSDIETIVDMVPNCRGQINKLMGIMTKNELVDVSGMDTENIRKMLKNGIYYILAVGKGCKYYSMVCTNSKEYLAELYGSDYFGKYEGRGARISELAYRLGIGENIGEALRYCGFDASDSELVDMCRSFVSRYSSASTESDKETCRSKLREGVSKHVFKEYPRSSSSTDSICCRGCFATLVGDGSTRDYYNFISPGKIEKVIRLA